MRAHESPVRPVQSLSGLPTCDIANVQRNYGNAIYVSSYRGEADDNDLVLLERYPVSLSNVQDVRCLEKRGWRRTVEEDDSK